MRSLIILLTNLLIAGASPAQTQTTIDTCEQQAQVKLEQTKKTCVYLDLVTAKINELEACQNAIINKLKAIREKQISPPKEL